MENCALRGKLTVRSGLRISGEGDYDYPAPQALSKQSSTVLSFPLTSLTSGRAQWKMLGKGNS